MDIVSTQIVDSVGGGILGAIASVFFFTVFSTILVSMYVPVSRIVLGPRWFRAIAISNRRRRLVTYYTVSCLVFIGLSLTVPVLPLLKWNQLDTSWHVASILSWLGVAFWLLMLVRVVLRTRATPGGTLEQ